MPRKPVRGGTQARIAEHLSAGDPTAAGDQGNDHAKHRHHEKPVARIGVQTRKAAFSRIVKARAARPARFQA